LRLATWSEKKVSTTPSKMEPSLFFPMSASQRSDVFTVCRCSNDDRTFLSRDFSPQESLFGIGRTGTRSLILPVEHLSPPLCEFECHSSSAALLQTLLWHDVDSSDPYGTVEKFEFFVFPPSRRGLILRCEVLPSFTPGLLPFTSFPVRAIFLEAFDCPNRRGGGATGIGTVFVFRLFLLNTFSSLTCISLLSHPSDV